MTANQGLVFYEKSHRYKLDGQWVPGVTTLIKGGLPNDALKFWSAKYVAEWVAEHPDITEQMERAGGPKPLAAFLKELPWQYSDNAKVRGTDVHDVAEKMVHGEPVEYPAHLEGYVQACVRFLDEWGVEPLVVERPLAHRAHWWAGKPDVFARIGDGRTVLFDYKTNKSGIYAETAFQLSAYSHAEFYADEDGTEHPVPAVDFCAAVQVRDDGTYDVIPVKADDDVYKEFRHLAFVSAAAKRAKGDPRNGVPGYVLPPIDPPATSQETAA